jgi:hypothetical protein
VSRGAQLFLLVLLALAVLGLGAAVVALRDTDCRSKRVRLAENITTNLRILRKRREVVVGLAAARDAETDPDVKGRLRRQIAEEARRTQEVYEILHLQLDKYEKIPVPWVFREAAPVDVAAARAEVAGE